MANQKKRVKIERQEMTKFHDFTKEKVCSGIVKGLREINTKFGAGTVIDVVNTKTGEMKGVMQTAGLKGYDWMGFVDQEVEIEFKDYQKTDNGIMMAFEVYVLE